MRRVVGGKIGIGGHGAPRHGRPQSGRHVGGLDRSGEAGHLIAIVSRCRKVEFLNFRVWDVRLAGQTARVVEQAPTSVHI